MSSSALKARIAQIRSQGIVAPPNTWIGTTSITKKNGKRYTYYRLMKAVPSTPTEDNPKPSPKTKMVKYLGSKDSRAYQEMKKAIVRRNEIARLLKKLQALDKQVSVDQSQKRKSKQPALTTLVMELVTQVQQLQTEMESLKRQLKTQLSTSEL
ncbi:MAG TPA: transposase [Cyanothece sp. UBA12306]|nr:transposase [Cyanothece sp. UBA12306]